MIRLSSTQGSKKCYHSIPYEIETVQQFRLDKLHNSEKPYTDKQTTIPSGIFHPLMGSE
jgi:hypothetical protein